MVETILKSEILFNYLISSEEYTKEEITQDEIIESSYDDSIFEVAGREYMVLTDNEADEKTKENILDSIWAFNPDFLESHTGIDKSIFVLLQDKCESSNEAIKSMIKDIDHFINDAVLSDGRGHFLNTYDGEENEFNYNSQWFYIYRVN